MAACYQRISVSDCNQLLFACKGLVVSRVWRSIDPTIFLEVGRLSGKKGRASRPAGQVTFMIEADWRLERRRSIQVGSGFTSTRIDKQIASLIGVGIDAAEVVGRLPELAIEFNDARRLASFTHWTSRPRWSIGFKDLSLFPLDPRWNGIDVTPWVHTAKAGRVEIAFCYDHTQAGALDAVRRMGFA